MRPLIPHFIAQQFDQGNFRGTFQAYTLFVDLTDFTPMTEKMLQRGKEGAEELSVILNDIFGPLVRTVYRNGGFIPYFAGDAFTAIFPTSIPGFNAVDLIETGVKIHEIIKNLPKVGDFNLGVKLGLAKGEIRWGILGDVHQAFYFRGKAVLACANGQKLARDSEMVLHHSLLNELPLEWWTTKTMDDAFFKLDFSKIEPRKDERNIILPKLDEEVAYNFLLDAVIGTSLNEEFRNVISIFISFEGLEDYESLHEFISLVINQFYAFSGYFKEVEFGDKGGVLVGFFGAPTTFENNTSRALEFVTTIRELLDPLQEITDLNFRIGMTSGVAFTGLVGGEERCQYAIVGSRVNLAARLMTTADWDTVLVDEVIQKCEGFDFELKGELAYKGFKEPIPTYILKGKSQGAENHFEGKLAGRKEELKKLMSFVVPLFKSKKPGFILLNGEAGVGKSRLIYELKSTLNPDTQLIWFRCQPDQILHKPFNLFTDFLKTYFNQSSKIDKSVNLARFEKNLNELIRETAQNSHPKSKEIVQELERTKPVLAALLGHSYENSIWDYLDAKGRNENTISALGNLFQAESLQHPLMLEIEDAQFLDENSKSFLVRFSRRLKDFPIILALLSRYSDDGSPLKILPEAELITNDIPICKIQLQALSKREVKGMGEEILGGPLGKKLLETLHKTSNGNPFYVEQILKYFIENELLINEDDFWNTKETTVALTDSIQSILTARVDRLSTILKNTVKTASVIGQEFELPVLMEVMELDHQLVDEKIPSNILVREQIQSAERFKIWKAISELRYIFEQSLFREAIYDMQLRKRLRKLHLLIARVIEKQYADRLESKYLDLAQHFQKAGANVKAIKYLEKAGDHSREIYQNEQAIHLYDELINLLEEEGNFKRKNEVLLKKAKLLQALGKWDEGAEVVESALVLANELDVAVLKGRSHNGIGHFKLLQGDYKTASAHLQEAVKFFKECDDKIGIYKSYGNVGNLFFRQGNYEKAQKYLKIGIEQALEIDRIADPQIIATLGLAYMNLGKYRKGVKWLKDNFEAAEARNDKIGMATFLTNMGIVFYEKGDMDDALDCYRQGLELSKQLGNKFLITIAIGSIGRISMEKGDYEEAEALFIRDLALSKELGDKQGIGIAHNLIGELYSIIGKFDEAIFHLTRSYAITSELGYKKGTALAANNLGDVYYLQRQFHKSMLYYDMAIEGSRAINNRLVLGNSLLEKGACLMQIGDNIQAVAYLEEAKEIAEELLNPKLLFNVQFLSGRIKRNEGEVEAAKEIFESMLTKELTAIQEASVYFELSKSNPKLVDDTILRYEKLYKKSKKALFKLRLEELREMESA